MNDVNIRKLIAQEKGIRMVRRNMFRECGRLVGSGRVSLERNTGVYVRGVSGCSTLY